MKYNFIEIMKHITYCQKKTTKSVISSCFILLLSLISGLGMAADGKILAYKNLDLRLKSFNNPDQKYYLLDKTKIAEAGCFSLGFGSRIQCFYCAQKTSYNNEHINDDLVSDKFHKPKCKFNSNNTSLESNDTTAQTPSENTLTDYDKSHYGISTIPGSNYCEPELIFTYITNAEFHENNYSTYGTEYAISCHICSKKSSVDKDIKVYQLNNPRYVKHNKDCSKSRTPYLTEY